MKKYALVIGIAVVAIGAVVAFQMRAPKQDTAPAMSMSPSPHSGAAGAGDVMAYTGTVLETMDAGKYTYVYVDTGSEKMWAAGPQTKVAVGETVAFPPGMEMQDFRSDTLDRTFDVVYFVSELRTGETAVKTPAGHPPVASPDQMAAGMDFSGIDVADGGERVAALYADKDKLAGKSVAVRGKVVKFTPGVMGKNWVHIMDGSGDAGHNDVAVTTDADVQVGDVVLVKGIMNLDRDFGMGYAYEILIEDASVTVE
jgi:hypothetical protein